MEPNPADYRDINRANWDSRVPHHEAGYELDKFRDDPRHLSSVVRFDLPRLPDLTGMRGVHLQCHIGSDTVSLARLGARMSGLDFSEPALDVARQLSNDLGLNIDFVQSDVYDARDVLEPGSFDFVFTGIGALCWLPSVAQWAQVVADLLRPGGFLFIREGHPVLWSMCDPRPDQLLVIEFPYFENEGTVFYEPTTYVEHEGELESPTTVSFNHGLAEIFNALWAAGLSIVYFEEHRSVPWNPLDEAMIEDPEFEGEFILREHRDRMPLTYTLRALKN